MGTHSKIFDKRKLRVRSRLRKSLKKNGLPRLCIHRTNSHIYAQIIDDAAGKTLASASTQSETLRSKLKNTSNRHAAEEVGKAIAKSAKKMGLEKVVFDRGGFVYHGRVEALAMGARTEGLIF